MNVRQAEAILDKFHKHISEAEIALDRVRRFEEHNGFYSSRPQLSHAIAELQAAAAEYDTALAAQKRLYFS